MIENALGWITIPARHIESMPDAELRRIELRENVERLAYSDDCETAKARLAEIHRRALDRGGLPTEPASDPLADPGLVGLVRHLRVYQIQDHGVGQPQVEERPQDLGRVAGGAYDAYIQFKGQKQSKEAEVFVLTW